MNQTSNLASCASGQRIHSLVCPVPAASPERPRYAVRVVSAPTSDLSEEDASISNPGLFSWSRGESSSRSESVPSPDLSDSQQAEEPRCNSSRSPPNTGLSYVQRLLAQNRGVQNNAGTTITPGSSNPTPVTLGRGQRLGLGRGLGGLGGAGRGPRF